MKRRRMMLAGTLALVLAAISMPATAQAYTQSYCRRLLAPNETCYSSGLHSWDFNSASYPGPPSHNIQVCQYVWNSVTLAIRGAILNCDANYVSWDYGATFGPTNDAIYNARVKLRDTNCCNHTVNGYAIA